MKGIDLGEFGQDIPKLGCPGDLAFMPFLKELKRYDNKLEIVQGEESKLTPLLESGAVNCAFLPSTDLYYNSDREMALPLGLSAGLGWSVMWCMREDSSNLTNYIEARLLEL